MIWSWRRAVRWRRVSSMTMTLLAAVGASAHAQSDAWQTVHQGSTWGAVMADHALSPKTALWFDGQWRRMGLGAQPQQLLLRPGIQFTLSPGVRVAAGVAYIATAPYGEAPSALPSRERRIWQQLALSHRAGPLSLSHRYRFEQRWLAPVTTSAAGANDLGPWQYQQRIRYMPRVSGNVPSLQFNGRPLMAYGWGEVLVPVGHGGASVRVTQSRLATGLGIPISNRQRVELGYMSLWNALGAARTNEVNHTLTVSWVWTSTK